MISVCIPTYEMHGLGDKYLSFSFDILCNQTYKDFNIIISDHSTSNLIKDVCDNYSNRLNIKYIINENDRGNFTPNLNNAINNADGDILKLLMQDDFLRHENSLKDISEKFDSNSNWLVTSCEHTQNGIDISRPIYPNYNNNIHLGVNTIGSPSVLSIRNDNNKLLFDDNLFWLMDCEYYKRCYEKFGYQTVLNNINVVIRTGDHQVTNTLATNEVRDSEMNYIKNKYR